MISALSLDNLWCLSNLLELLDDWYMSLWTRTCVLSTVLWIFWLVGTCLCLPSGTSIPIKMQALRYLTRLPYRLDGWYWVLYHNWDIYDHVNVLES